MTRALIAAVFAIAARAHAEETTQPRRNRLSLGPSIVVLSNPMLALEFEHEIKNGVSNVIRLQGLPVRTATALSQRMGGAALAVGLRFHPRRTEAIDGWWYGGELEGSALRWYESGYEVWATHVSYAGLATTGYSWVFSSGLTFSIGFGAGISLFGSTFGSGVMPTMSGQSQFGYAF